MQKVVLRLGEQDIEDARRYGLQNAILYLLSNATGTLWRLSECGVAIEIMVPYRTALIWGGHQHLWRSFPKGEAVLPCDLHVEFQEFGQLKIQL